jgi:hypothetical protein
MFTQAFGIVCFSQTTYFTQSSQNSAFCKELNGLGHNAKNMRIILRDINSNKDYITTEEKPSEAEKLSDVVKSRTLQAKTLTLWRNQIGCDELISRQ